ncbi:unnamed protein product [Mytilus edulis]|uniref:Uncharacterized protein n=1 Tax=Mytilus edulis TaxID=6550 RepID=A0A8S3RND8_MYTED|nr:unnamed protein product [Mytilus edulis]
MSDIEPDNLLNDIQPEVASHAAVPDEEISNADLLSLMQNYFGKKLSGIERNFADTTQDLARKVKKTENNLRYKGNQVQFDLNSDILDNISGALENLLHKKYSKAVSLLKESEKLLKKRNKLIRIADKSEAEWKTVDEYLSDEVASNSEDEKKIRAAETRAVKKMKVTKGSTGNRSAKKRPAEAAGGPSSVARGADGVVTVSQSPFRPETSATSVGCMGIGPRNARMEGTVTSQLPEDLLNKRNSDILEIVDKDVAPLGVFYVLITLDCLKGCWTMYVFRGHWTICLSVTGRTSSKMCYLFALCSKIFSTGFWSENEKVAHPELRLLLHNLPTTVTDARAKSTVDKYSGGFKRFAKWTEKYREITCILPCKEIYDGVTDIDELKVKTFDQKKK